jgi:uncharacterized protein YndB with AHSA1/START domain
MAHEFELREEITLAATPEQVWAAIATGPGVDSWFMGRTEIEPGPGGRTRITAPGWSSESTITAWEPGQHFAYREDEHPDGTFMAFEYLLEGRDGGSTVLRFVHSGFLGDDWEEQYDALRKGDRIYLAKLACYLRYFPGRTASFSTLVPGPKVPDEQRAWSRFLAAFGVSTVAEGAPARLAIAGIDPADGVAGFLRQPDAVVVCTADALYVLMLGMGMAFAEYHGFDQAADHKAVEAALQEWLAGATG